MCDRGIFNIYEVYEVYEVSFFYIVKKENVKEEDDTAYLGIL